LLLTFSSAQLKRKVRIIVVYSWETFLSQLLLAFHVIFFGLVSLNFYCEFVLEVHIIVKVDVNASKNLGKYVVIEESKLTRSFKRLMLAH
jgi:hypothetical protein